MQIAPPVPILGTGLENPGFFSSLFSSPKIRNQTSNVGKHNPHNVPSASVPSHVVEGKKALKIKP